MLKQMTPERILEVMTTGSMRNAAAALSDQDKRLIAEWVAGRKLDTDLGRRGREDAERVRESSAGARIERAGLERLGRRLPELAVPAGAAAGLSPGQVSRLQLKWAFGFPGRHGAVRPDGVRRAAVRDVERRLRLLARRRDRMRALGLPRAVGRAERVHDRPAQPDGSASRDLLRRHPRHGVRALRQHRRGDLEDARPIRIRSRGSPARRCSSKDDCTCRSRRSKSRSRDRPITPAARSAATCRRSMRRPGSQIWKTYTIPEVPKVVGKNSRGKDMLEPAGAGIWVTPTLDVKRRALYFGTGNAFSGTPKTANAVMAMNMDTGKVLWSMQALPFDTWHNGCVQNIPGRRVARPWRGAAAPAARHAAVAPVGRRPFRIRRKTAPQSSGPTGTSRRLPRSRQPPTDATSSSRRRNRDSSGRSIPTTGRCSGSRTSRAKSRAAAARRCSAARSTTRRRTSV